MYIQSTSKCRSRQMRFQKSDRRSSEKIPALSNENQNFSGDVAPVF